LSIASAALLAIAMLAFADEVREGPNPPGHDMAVPGGTTSSRAPSPHAIASAPSPVRSADQGHSRALPFPRLRTVYAADGPTDYGQGVRGIPGRVYVPNTMDGTVDEIDPRTGRIVRRLRVGGQPHHVTPSWDLRHLYVDNPGNDRLQVIDPRTGRITHSIRVASPYNLYFTPDGTKAIVVAEYDRLIQFRDPHTWKLIKQVSIPWPGVDHLDFSADGSYLLVSCEYSGMVVRVSTRTMAITGTVQVGGRPIDVKVSPDGRVFYVANQGLSGVSVIDPARLRQVSFIPTGVGAHGFAVSRNGRFLYVSNRIEGSISVISFQTRKQIAKWRVGGSPDMLQVSPDGSQLWASNRFTDTISVISTNTGRLLSTIRVGNGPHGLAYFPQPGRYSVGHNGVYR